MTNYRLIELQEDKEYYQQRLREATTISESLILNGKLESIEREITNIIGNMLCMGCNVFAISV